MYYGTRHVTTSTKAVNTLADMKGLKLRVPEKRCVQGDGRSWGAPDADEFQRDFICAQTGASSMVRKIRCPPSRAAKFHEVQKYLVLSGHIMTPRPGGGERRGVAEDRRGRPQKPSKMC